MVFRLVPWHHRGFLESSGEPGETHIQASPPPPTSPTVPSLLWAEELHCYLLIHQEPTQGFMREGFYFWKITPGNSTECLIGTPQNCKVCEKQGYTEKLSRIKGRPRRHNDQTQCDIPDGILEQKRNISRKTSEIWMKSGSLVNASVPTLGSHFWHMYHGDVEC